MILRDGMEGVSIRDVAAEAGLSTGALRHYFSTKEELLAAAARLVVERVVGRFEEMPRATSLREGVRNALCEVLPLDDRRRTEGAIWLAFAARSLVDPRIAEEHEMVFDGIREVCERVIHELAVRGRLSPGLDPEREAGRLHALVDGLCVHGLMGRLDEGGMLGVLDAHLDEILHER